MYKSAMSKHMFGDCFEHLTNIVVPIWSFEQVLECVSGPLFSYMKRERNWNIKQLLR